MLVAEDQGGEIDVGAGRCHMMEAIEMKGTKANADKEEWDVVGRAPPGWTHPLLPGVEAKAAKAAKSKKAKAGSAADGGAGSSGGGLGGAELARALAKELQSLKVALRLICKHKEADAFLDPVDYEALGLDDYPSIVTHPMDLGTVTKRLEGGHYDSTTVVRDVAADVDQIWANCFEYNKPDNWVHAAATVMKAFAEKKLEPLVAAANARLAAVEPPQAPAAAAAPVAETPESVMPLLATEEAALSPAAMEVEPQVSVKPEAKTEPEAKPEPEPAAEPVSVPVEAPAPPPEPVAEPGVAKPEAASA